MKKKIKNTTSSKKVARKKVLQKKSNLDALVKAFIKVYGSPDK